MASARNPSNGEGHSAVTVSTRQTTETSAGQKTCPGLSADVHHIPRGLLEPRLPNMMPRLLAQHHPPNIFMQLRRPSRRAASRHRNRGRIGRTGRCGCLPSEVIRTRLQCPQKGRDTGAMIPISPTPSAKVNRLAVSLAVFGGSSTSPAGTPQDGRHAVSRATISSIGTTVSGVQLRSSSSGINSINRTTTPSRRENSANASIWLSLKPRSSTQLTLTGPSPAAFAARIPASTRS